jgi:RNA polymerase sigma-70 factor (ECF subfamily)
MAEDSVDPAHDRDLAGLLALAQTGDRSAYQRFLFGACEVLRPFLARRMRDAELAEDVLQETLLAIHRARHTYLPGRAVGPWLYTICEHRLVDFLRRRRRIARVETPAAEVPRQAGDEPAMQPDPPAMAPRAALDALERLPGKQRRVIELLKLHDMSVREVAHQFGMSESAVKVTAFRGYQAMRKIMGVNRS